MPNWRDSIQVSEEPKSSNWRDSIVEAPIERSSMEVSAEGLGQSIRNNLPAALSMVGSIGGSALAGPVGTVAGGAGGYAVGKLGQDLYDQYIDGKVPEDTNPLEKISRVSSDLVDGGASSAMGAGIGKLAGMAASGLSNKSKQVADYVMEKVTDPSRVARPMISGEELKTAGGISLLGHPGKAVSYLGAKAVINKGPEVAAPLLNRASETMSKVAQSQLPEQVSRQVAIKHFLENKRSNKAK